MVTVLDFSQRRHDVAVNFTQSSIFGSDFTHVVGFDTPTFSSTYYNSGGINFTQSGTQVTATVLPATAPSGMVDFSSVTRAGADFSFIHLGGLYVGGDYTGANLTSVDFAGADPDSSDFTGANFTNANLTGIFNFNDALLNNANLTGANLRGSLIEGYTSSTDENDPVVTGVTWSNTTCVDGSLSDDNVGSTCVGQSFGQGAPNVP